MNPEVLRKLAGGNTPGKWSENRPHPSGVRAFWLRDPGVLPPANFRHPFGLAGGQSIRAQRVLNQRMRTRSIRIRRHAFTIRCSRANAGRDGTPCRPPGERERGGGRVFMCADGTECHPYRRGTLLRRKDVSETAFQPAHDLAEAAEGDALVAALQSVERGGRQAELFGKLGVGHFAALDAEKFAELAFQRSGHASQARGEFIPDAECFGKSRFTVGVGLRSVARVEGGCRPLVQSDESRL